MSLEETKKKIISSSIKIIVSNLTDDKNRKLMLLIPDNAKKELGI